MPEDDSDRALADVKEASFPALGRVVGNTQYRTILKLFRQVPSDQGLLQTLASRMLPYSVHALPRCQADIFPWPSFISAARVKTDP